MVNWSCYLESLCNTYAQWWQVYTITDVVGRKRDEAEPSPLLFDFGLMVQTVEREREERGKREEKIERLTVLEGLRKYASEHVLLVGRPGSGKSTALVRLVLEEAKAALTPPPPSPKLGEGGETVSNSLSLAPLSLDGRGAGGEGGKIPVLVELRYYQESVLDLIRNFLKRHQLLLEIAEIERLLFEGQLLLLLDGLNELPSEEARRDLQKFRQDYQKTTPMIFTTRDLGVGGDLDIAKKLEMQPLSEAQMQQFVRAYLPQQGEQMLRQLGSRLREFGRTPLLLWMLCSVFRAMGKVPPNLGLVFRQFALSYDRKLKQDIPIPKESRRWWHRLLEDLAWVMTSGEAKTELQVAISRRQAEAVMTEFLAGKVAHPEDCALGCLEDLLKHHLIQLGANNQIEFRHQLIQEYYTAESLLKLLPSLGDDELKREYLNYLKWTEPVALMLELVEDEAQAVRVVKLALEVDLRLGARLAGAVKPVFQAQTVDLVVELEIPQILKISLLDITQSDRAVSALIKALENEDLDICNKAAEALGRIGSETAVSTLIEALEHENLGTCTKAAEALGEIGSETAVPSLIKALEHENLDICTKAAEALGRIGSETAVPSLIKALEHENLDICTKAAEALGEIGNETAVSGMLKVLKSQKTYAVRRSIAEALGKIGSKKAVPELLKILGHKNFQFRQKAAESLIQINSDSAASGLMKSLDNKSNKIRRRIIDVLGKLNSESVIPILEKALGDKDNYIRRRGIEALCEISSETKITALIKALENDDFRVRRIAAQALYSIGNEAGITYFKHILEKENSYILDETAKILDNTNSELAIPFLVKDLTSKNLKVRIRAVYLIGQIGTEAVIPALLKALKNENPKIRWRAAKYIGRIGSKAEVPPLLKLMEGEESSREVLLKVIEALGKIGAEAAVPALVKALENKNKDYGLRKTIVNALGAIGSQAATSTLLRALEDKDFGVRERAVKALVKLDIPESLPYFFELLLAAKVNTNTLFAAISAVQERYRYYNYTLTSSKSHLKSLRLKPNLPLDQYISTQIMYILHLSDLHFGTPDQANLWSNQVAADLYNDLSISHLDALILSGDIANYSTEEEYKAAEQFLDNLRQDFPLNPEQIILVPGNHDLNWKLAEEAYRLERRKNYKGELREGSYIDKGDIIEVRDEEDYKQRFAHFSQFYETIKQKPYPLDYDQQYTLDHLKEQNLLILGLNSAWQLDHHYKSRASINTNALSNALTQIRRHPDYKNSLKIAVWHHPLHSAYSDRITDQGFLEQLAVNGFRFFLHGHIHKAETSLYRYDMSTNGRKLDRICAGTFGAPVREWVPGYPLQYNLLKIEDNQLTVYTRRREELNGAWKPDARWLQGAGKAPLDYYAIAL